MQIVIDIPKEQYENLAKIVNSGKEPLGYCERVVMRGTPLQMGHGRLIDGDKLFSDMQNGIYAGLYEEGYEKYGHILNMDDCLEEVEAADTIIQADMEKHE